MVKKESDFSINLLFIFMLLFKAAVPVYAITYTKPVITSSLPAQIEVSQAGGELELVLQGENFLISGNTPIWNSREIILYVRHSLKGGNWQGLYNNLRDGGRDPGTYPNPPRAFGKCYYDSNSKIRVWLSRSIWCNSEGTLQFLLIKGKWGNGPPPMMVTEMARSNVHYTPVKGSVSGITEIDSLIPEFYYVNQKNPYPPWG